MKKGSSAFVEAVAQLGANDATALQGALALTPTTPSGSVYDDANTAWTVRICYNNQYANK